MAFQRLVVGFSNVLVWLNSIDPAIRSPITIALGAVPGALSRYYLTLWFAQGFGTRFPYGTFFINATGSLVMGFFVTLMLERAIAAPDLRLLVAVGFLGSYTTFSTYALDTLVLLQAGNWGRSLFYWAGSAILGIGCVALGSFWASKLLSIFRQNIQ